MGGGESLPSIAHLSFPLEHKNETLMREVIPCDFGVVVFGDSWAEDNSVKKDGPFAGVTGWPQQLVRSLSLPLLGNFAVGGSESVSLKKQLKKAMEVMGVRRQTWSRAFAVIHSGGNDFIGSEKGYNMFEQDNFWPAYCLWGCQRKTLEVLGNIRVLLEGLFDLGCRRFLVSELPLTSWIPALVVARSIRIDERGRWINFHLAKSLVEFMECHRTEDLDVGIFRETHVLQNLVTCMYQRGTKEVERMYLKDQFHPTHETHRLIMMAAASKLPRVDMTLEELKATYGEAKGALEAWRVY